MGNTRPGAGTPTSVTTLGVVIALGMGVATDAQEPMPRTLAGTPIAIHATLATISGVRELRSGHLLLSDARTAVVLEVDPKTGRATQIGSAGGDELQYAQPGGFYAGLGDTVLLLDRGLSKVLLITPPGKIVGARSIKEKGITGSSSDDTDHKRLDATGLAYYSRWLTMARGTSKTGSVDSVALVRFDAVTQRAETVTTLRQLERRIVQSSDSYQMTRDVFGTPMDDYGVMPDGRVAIVRGAPYRVEWHAHDGRTIRGPEYAVAPIAYTQAEKDSVAAATHGGGGGGASASMSGGAPLKADDAQWFFAASKAPFERNAMMVSPAGEVWVRRAQAFGTAGTIYDVFDNAGKRIDRVQLAGHVRIVGFGPSAAYAMGRDGATVSLVRYATKR